MNHSQSGKGHSAMVLRVALFSALIAGLLLLLYLMKEKMFQKPSETEPELAYMLPTGGDGELVFYPSHALSYAEKHEQPEWVVYALRADKLSQSKAVIEENFRPDPAIPTQSAALADYQGTAYKAGQLLPAADRAYSPALMGETFLMSNVSPQAPGLDAGVWRELEELVREWAMEAGKLYVATGPVLAMQPKGEIGANKVSVPAAYYKVVLDLEPPGLRALGFILPNTVTYEPLPKFAASVDEVERITGLDFFTNFMPEEVEAEVEARYEESLWAFSQEKYRKRVEKWNKQ